MDYITNLIAAVETRELKIPEGTAVIPLVLFALLMLAILFGSVIGWISILIAKISKFPLPLRSESHNPPPWGGIDVVLVFAFWMGIQIFAGIILRYANLLPPATPNPDASSLWVMTLGQTIGLLSVGISAIWLVAWFKSQSQYSGWSCRYLLYDVLLGAAVFILSAPMLYALMALASFATDQKYNHPLIDAVNKDPSNIIFAFWVAVICAPFIEEFAFRVLLQGYFQSLAEKSSVSKLWIALIGRGRISEPVLASAANLEQSSLTSVLSVVPSVPISDNPYVAGSVGSTQQPVIEAAPEVEQQPNATVKFWPILLSGTLFGLAHFDYGASWIPLIFFGCVLGWLYQKTNRIWPSLTAHMFCNFMGTSSIFMQTLVGPPT